MYGTEEFPALSPDGNQPEVVAVVVGEDPAEPLAEAAPAEPPAKRARSTKVETITKNLEKERIALAWPAPCARPCGGPASSCRARTAPRLPQRAFSAVCRLVKATTMLFAAKELECFH